MVATPVFVRQLQKCQFRGGQGENRNKALVRMKIAKLSQIRSVMAQICVCDVLKQILQFWKNVF